MFDTMETHRLLFIAATEGSLGDRSKISPLLKGQATHPVGFLKTIDADYGIINDPISGSLRPEGAAAKVSPE